MRKTLCLVILVVGCGSPDAPPPTSLDHVRVEAHEAEAVTGMIPPEGGSIEARGPDGRAYVLDVPEGALLEPTEITMTPTTLTGMGEPVASVRFAPEGLSFIRSARLRLLAETEAPPDELIAVSFSDDRTDWTLLPITEVEGGWEVPVLHFSEAAIIWDQEFYEALIIEQYVTGPVHVALSDIATAEGEAGLVQALRAWWEDSVLPHLMEALEDDEAIVDAITDFNWWLAEATHFTVDDLLAEEIAMGRELLRQGMHHAIDTANQRCVDNQDPLTWVARVEDVYGMMAVTGIADLEPELGWNQVLDELCLQIDITSIEGLQLFIDSSSTTLTVHATATLGGEPYEMPLEVEVSCSATDCGATPSAGPIEGGEFETSVFLFSGADSANPSFRVRSVELPFVVTDRMLQIPRGQTWVVFGQPDGLRRAPLAGGPSQIVASTPGAIAVAFARTLDRIAFAALDPATPEDEGSSAIEVARSDGFARERVTAPPHSSGPDFSPDGRHVAFHRNRFWELGTYAPDMSDLAVVDVETQLATTLVTMRSVGSVRWSPTGDWIVFAGTVMDGSEQNAFLVRPDGTGLHGLFSGMLLASRNTTGSAWRWEGDGLWFCSPDALGWISIAGEVQGMASAFGGCTNPSALPDGRVAVTTSAGLEIVDFAAGSSIAVGDGTLPSVGPAGEWVAYVDGNSIRAVRANGSDDHLVTTTSSPVYALSVGYGRVEE